MADQVTILKSGKSIATINAKKTTTKILTETMVGNEITSLKKVNVKSASKDIALELKNLSKQKEMNMHRNIDIT